MNLQDYLLQNLIAVEYEKLHETLGVTRSMKSRLIKRPERMNYKQVIILSELLNNGISATELVMMFHCGFDRITMRQMEELNAKSLQL